MSKFRMKARIDSNQSEIVKQLRQIPGVTVALSHDDILIGHRGLTYWYEIKTPECVSKTTGKIRECEKKKDQKMLEKTWTGHYKIVSSIDEILLEIHGGVPWSI